VHAVIALLFCLFLGVMLKVQGFSALLWLPVGFVISLYVTAQIALPVMLGMPRAIRLVANRQMRAGVFIRLLVVPAIWAMAVFGGLFLLGYFRPSVAAFVEANTALNVGLWLGTVAIILSPISRKSRSDFREDFDRAYSCFYKPTQQKYREAAITVATNLYLHTIPEAEDAPAPLQFSLPDSRARYMIFCLSAVLTAALAYDEKKQIQPEALIEGCLRAANLIATKDAQEYLGGLASSQDSVENASAYLKEFLNNWSRWPELEKEGRNAEIIDLISSMIHTTESKNSVTESDKKRLGPLALQIDCWLPTMRGAMLGLASKG
jgi:hypothetical protein